MVCMCARPCKLSKAVKLEGRGALSRRKWRIDRNFKYRRRRDHVSLSFQAYELVLVCQGDRWPDTRKHFLSTMEELQQIRWCTPLGNSDITAAKESGKSNCEPHMSFIAIFLYCLNSHIEQKLSVKVFIRKLSRVKRIVCRFLVLRHIIRHSSYRQ
jgi:hypothetical protein